MEEIKKYRLEQLFENIQIDDIELHKQAQKILNKQAEKRLEEIKEFLKFNG